MITLEPTTAVTVTLTRDFAAGVTLSPPDAVATVLQRDQTVTTFLTAESSGALTLAPASSDMAVTLAPFGAASIEFPAPSVQLSLALAPVLQASRPREQDAALVYDEEGTLTRVNNEDGSCRTLTYDEGGALIQVAEYSPSDVLTKTRILTYNGGRLAGTSVTYP
ncbi:hypothetical protein ACXYMO_04700 [Arenibacterium sp. CAU 1754]